MLILKDPITGQNPTSFPAWKKLEALASKCKKSSLSNYFETDPARHKQYSVKAANLNANLSRHFIDNEVRDALLTLAKTANLSSAIEKLKNGENINFTEQRPALHTALRTPIPDTPESALAIKCRLDMRQLCEQLQQQQWPGQTGKAITDIVNIGIGGSDLGPRMTTEALTPYHSSSLNVHFVTNIDPCDLDNTLATLDAETTLFIVTSKSWTTLETLTNAQTAKQWLIKNLNSTDIHRHFIGITANTERCQDFGIKTVLPMWDWVGGRFSLWSAAGLPIALATSFETFESLLAGAHEMDEHFFNTPETNNLPTLLALLEIWYVNFWQCSNVAVLPYDHTLRLLPNHLQQLAMESNGKSVDRSGQTVNYETAPVLWGSAGTIGQHSFHQLLHQGTQLIPVDFILPLSSHHDNAKQHQHMVANCLAQAQTLMDGEDARRIKIRLLASGMTPHDAEILAQHKAMPANRPSTIISFDKLTAYNLGSLISLYEHKTFAASIIWNINAFDQWGVELGKSASSAIYTQMQNKQNDACNPATLAALNEFKQLNY